MKIRECYFYDTVALELRQTRVKRFTNCTIWTARHPDGARFILLDERARHHTTICEYDELSEFEDDLAYLTDPSRTEAELFGKLKE